MKYIREEKEKHAHRHKYIYIYIYTYMLTARSLSTLVTPQCNPTMCNRTSCAQVQELP